MVGYFDLVPDPRSADAKAWDALVDAEEPDEDPEDRLLDPDDRRLRRLRQEIQALYGEYLERLKKKNPNVTEHCAGCEVRRNYGWDR